MKRISKVILIISLFCLIPRLYAEDTVNFWGQVLDKNKIPFQGAMVTVSSKSQEFSQTLTSDDFGYFRLSGLPSGLYTIICKADGYPLYVQENVPFEPLQTIFLEIILNHGEEAEKLPSDSSIIDYSNCTSQTIIDQSQIHTLPTARNIWALVENQDLSATTNRIDVGGMWSDTPALFSSRGASSWTQNIYLLNGLDVTDPYWTGMPLFFPDLIALRFTQLINAGHPPQALNPGAYFNLVTREGESESHGGISTYFINKNMKSSNISHVLRKEGIFESHSFNYCVDSNFYLSGPVVKDRLFFFTSWKALNLSRDIADYNEDDKASLYSGFLSLKYNFSQSTLRFIWSSQLIYHPSFGAGRSIPYSATTNQKNFYNVIQLIWNLNPSENSSLKIGCSLNHGKLDSDFQDSTNTYHRHEIFKKTSSGAAPLASEDTRASFTLFLKAESLRTRFLKARHLFQYGVQFQHTLSSSKKKILENLHLRFFEGNPLEIVKYNTPVHHRESAIHLNVYAQDSFSFSNFISFYLGFNVAYSRGWVPSQSHIASSSDFTVNSPKRAGNINWFNISPRVGLIFPLSKQKSSALKISLGRYYFTLPLYLLTYGNPNALGGLAYTWQDINNDNQYQQGEEKTLIRREGPFFSRIDTGLKRPYTDEAALSFIHTFGSSWYLAVSVFFRESKNLIETTNIGVPFSAYNPLEFYDEGDDRIPGTNDDLNFTVYNQKREFFGQDFFLLTNPDTSQRTSKYQGLDLILFKKYSSKLTFFLSLTATQAIGTTSPGNTEWENDDGLVGSLYDNPNTLINARGKLRFDRAYTGRIGCSYLAPHDIRISCVIKYYDGQPFARKIIITGMNQGPFYIQAHPRGVARYEYNRTVDIRIEKTFTWRKVKLRIILDSFNIFNRGLAVEENEWTGPEFPLRFATEIQSPRVFRLGLAYEF
ncbi:MAG: carboxypeptidase regulatory-like domain-containing protein [Candidatus Aminicenantaceae bacterium]